MTYVAVHAIMLLIYKVPLGSAQTINNTVHTRLLIKNSGTFPGFQTHFPRPCHKPAMFKYRDKQQLLTILIYSMITASIQEYVFITVTCCQETVQTLYASSIQNRGVRTRIFWHLRPHHCPANSRTLHLDFTTKLEGLLESIWVSDQRANVNH